MKTAILNSVGRQLTIQPVAEKGNDYEGIRETCRAAGSRYDGQLKREVLPVRRVVELVRESVVRSLHLRPTAGAAGAVRTEAERVREESLFLESVCGDGELYPFQAEGVGYLWENPSALLFDEMGLGKTIQALVALPERAAVLVVCPAVAKSVWKTECTKWRPDLDSQVLEKFRWPEPGELLIINYERLMDADDLKTHPYPKANVIFDEAQYLKNGRSLRTRRSRVLVNRMRKRHGLVWLLTGTPLMNKPQELWSLLVILGLHKSAFGNYTNFAKAFGGVKDGFGWLFDAGKVTEEAVSVVRSLCLRRERAEVLPDLPTKTYQTWSVDRPNDVELVRQIDSIDMDLLELALDDMESVEMQDVALLSSARKELAGYKLTETMPLIREYESAEVPLVVFCAHRNPVEELGARAGWGCIHGKLTEKKRVKALEDFQEGKLKGIAITIAAGGTAITLTHGHHVIFIDRSFTPTDNLQAEDRVCRIGQDRGVIVTEVVCKHPVDERVAHILRHKMEMISATTGQIAESGRTVDREALAQELDTIATMMGAS